MLSAGSGTYSIAMFSLAGQRQVTAGNAYNSRYSFSGELSALSIHDTILTQQDMTELATPTAEGHQRDQLVAWSSVIGHIHGDVTVRNGSWVLGMSVQTTAHL